MVAIMESLQHYVPHIRKTNSVPVPGKSGEYEEVHHDYFHHILFGGDQVTKVRADGAQRMRSNSQDEIDRAQRFSPSDRRLACKAMPSWDELVHVLFLILLLILRFSGSDCIAKLQTWMVALCISFAI